MASKKNSNTIEIVNPVCCGLDIHKTKINACIIYQDADGEEKRLLKEFKAFTNNLISLRDWLLENECPIVAMESTGIYWRPVHNVLEGHLHVILVNAQHYKSLPGKKTDVSDCQWLAGLLRHGLLRGSFIPPQEIRDWRDLVTLRKSYTEDICRFKLRTQKLFETANIKIDSIASDLFGVSGRNLMNLLLKNPVGQITPEMIGACLKGRLAKKAEEFCLAMQGFFRPHHKATLQMLLRTIKNLEQEVARLDRRLERLTQAHQELLERLEEIPGISRTSAIAILARVGTTLEEFGSAAHLASWCGLCPGNHESAGKRMSGRSKVRGHPLKTIMVEVAWAAVRTKGSYYREKYFRLRSRRGSKRAIIAIAHRILKAIYHIIKNDARFEDLGEKYLVELTEKASLARLATQAKKHGFRLVPAQ
jgi:transposase